MKDENGKQIQREKAVSTKTGFILTSKDGKEWQMDFPNGSSRYGGNTSASKIAIFFLMLGLGHGIEYASEVAFHETKLRGKHRVK